MKIKICGLFREDDVGYVNQAKPDYIGFVFAESRRKISPECAAKLKKKLDGSITAVGVFADADIADIAALYKSGIIDAAQLHGGEDIGYIDALKAISGMTIIKAIKAEDISDTERYARSGADFLLFDGAAGGSGKPFDWKLLKNISKPFFLAGGIDLKNIQAAAALSPAPYALDVSSGAESGGLKDGDKIAELVKMVRSVR
ncbi:MAG: phosphoribosylanthranilate isomerase [Clostridiales bacterium]|jgi:phosphoribosylanthranilate isomerase|nr:phosphoribosylanthranilate isomerase [Clostridiales bacterium]